MTLWSLKPFKALFAKGGALEHWVLKFHVPYLDNLVIKTAPIVAADKPYEALYKLDLLSAVGTAILSRPCCPCCCCASARRRLHRRLGETLLELKRPILSIGMVLAFAFVANYSGMSSTLALCLANTGKASSRPSSAGWGVPDRFRHLVQCLEPCRRPPRINWACRTSCWWRPIPPAA